MCKETVKQVTVYS